MVFCGIFNSESNKNAYCKVKPATLKSELKDLLKSSEFDLSIPKTSTHVKFEESAASLRHIRDRPLHG